MPIPIRPINDQVGSKDALQYSDKGDQSMFMLNLDALAGSAFGGNSVKAAMKVTAEASDDEAELLLELFNKSQIVSEAESTEDKKYAVPKSFPNDKLLRLKAASLVHGDTAVIGFTSKAVRVIKTLVLAEPNSYERLSVKKPYSVIMAENKMASARHSTLAFQKTT
jgi:hypothetical protein